MEFKYMRVIEEFKELENIDNNYAINTESYKLKSGKYIYFTTVYCFMIADFIEDLEARSYEEAVKNHIKAIKAFMPSVKI